MMRFRVIVTALLMTWAFFAGTLLAGWWGHRAVRAQYEARLREAQVRQDVLAGAVLLLSRDKFHAYAATVAAASREARR